MTTIYQQYLVADMLAKRLEAIGLTTTYTMFSKDYEQRGTAGAEVQVSIDYNNAAGKWMTDAEREAKVNEFLELYPQATINRESEHGGKPDMKVRGVTAVGIAWEINFHSGVCEQVQVGVRSVERIDPDAYATLPKITVEEPVYQYLCPDPLRELVVA